VNLLTAFGLFAVSAMLIFYALESRGRHYVLGFAGACMLGSIYGFLQGAWPFGLVEAVWAMVALRRWAGAGKKAVSGGTRQQDERRASRRDATKETPGAA
jgi:uncharacterized membrane protein